jgi:membrane associated rhomboid family serine protease
VSARRPPQRGRIDWSQVKITRGALIILGLQVGVSLVFMLANKDAKVLLDEWLVATPHRVFEQGRVWTLATAPFLELDFLSLLLSALMLWMLVPTLERFWGTPRFIRFVAITSIVGSVGGVLAGLALGTNWPIQGLSPFTYAAVVAFGIIYARQPVQFFGVLPLTGRQMMYGFLGFLVLFITLQGLWEKGASFAAAMIAAAIMVSKKWSPGLALKRWRIARARAKLSVLEGGASTKPATKPGKRDERWLN